jgi:hypothetical protein
MYTIVRQHNTPNKILTFQEIKKYIEVSVTQVDEKLVADDDDKSLEDFNELLPVKECELSDLENSSDKLYGDKFFKEIQLSKGVALCPDFKHPNYKNAGWKNHLGKSTFKYI